MDPKIRFFFYLAAFIVFVFSFLGRGVKLGRRSITEVPLGLALWLFPTLWDTAEAAW
ncbi:MAG: hypothetical protein ABL953_10135 [Ilumatobacteraceae bacterium]